MNINKVNEKNIIAYKQKIKESGFRLTRTRMVILDTFLKSHGEISAEELFFLSHKKYPKIGQATIYRNLKLLEKEGLVEKAGYENNRVKYRIKDNPDFNSNSMDSKKIRHDRGENKKKTGIKDNTAVDIGYPSDISYGSNFKDYMDMERINTIQSQLTEWLGDLKKIKREKEWALEDTIKDFAKVDKIINDYRNQRNELIQILLDIQNKYRWLPKHILLYVSNRLDIPLTNIYDITTFYKYFNLEPQGRNSIVVCMGTACHVRGAMNLLQRIVNVLGIKPGDTTGDYKFTLNTVNCLGCCALGPVVMIGNKYYSNPSTGNLKKILKGLN